MVHYIRWLIYFRKFIPFDPFHPFHPPSKPCLCACIFSHVRIFATPWTAVCQAPLSMEFSRQNYWSELPFPTLGDLPTTRVKPASPGPPALAGRFFVTEPPGKPTSGQPPVWVCELPQPLVPTWDVLSLCKSSPAARTSLLFLQPCQHIPSSEPLPLAFSLPGTLSPRGSRDMLPLYFLQIFLQMPPNQWGHPRLFSYSALFFSVTLSPPDVRKSICLGAYMCFPNQNVSWWGGQTLLRSLQCPQFPKHNIPSEIVLDWMNKLAQSVEHETLNLKVVG